jgi:hypothetical protein
VFTSNHLCCFLAPEHVKPLSDSKGTSTQGRLECQGLSVPGNKLLHVSYSDCYVMLYDRLCGLLVRVSDYSTMMYCDSCEVRTEFIYAM